MSLPIMQLFKADIWLEMHAAQCPTMVAKDLRFSFLLSFKICRTCDIVINIHGILKFIKYKTKWYHSKKFYARALESTLVLTFIAWEEWMIKWRR